MKNFPYIFDTQYTAKLETELDAVEDGEERWTDLLNGFYDHFEKELVVAGKNMEDIKRMEQATSEICDKCGSPLMLKWGKFGSFYSCSNFTRLKPITVAAGPWKKDSKAVMKKITKALSFPMTVKATVEDVTEFSQDVADVKEMVAAIEQAQRAGKKVTVEQVSCDFTKENFAAKPDLSAPGADDVPEEEFCDNCGKEMVLKNGPWGPFMSCPDYSADPPCRTIRKLTQKVQQKPPVQLDEACPKCGKPLLQRDGQYGEFIACSGLSEVQVREAGAAGRAVPEGRRRHCRAQDQARRHVLWLRELSEVRLCQQPEAGEPDVPEVRQRLSAGSGERRRDVTWSARTTGRRCPSGGRRKVRRWRRRRRRSAATRRRSGRRIAESVPALSCLTRRRPGRWSRASPDFIAASTYFRRGTRRSWQVRQMQSVVLELYKLRQETALRAARKFMGFEFWPKDLEELRAVSRNPAARERLLAAGDQLLGDGGFVGAARRGRRGPVPGLERRGVLPLCQVSPLACGDGERERATSL